MVHSVFSSSGRAGFSGVASRALRVAALVCGAALSSAARATPPMPLMPQEAEPAAWQRAGIGAALEEADSAVQYHALDYCRRKEWVAQFHFPTAQWLKWLGHEDAEVRELAAKAAAQLGAQMPAEVQRALLHLQNDTAAGSRAQLAATQALGRLAQAMPPETQMSLVAFLQSKGAPSEALEAASLALGQTGAAMTPATQQALLALMHDTRTTPNASPYAASALAHLGTHMPPPVRQAMLGVLLDARADATLRSTAAEAMGRLGPQMPAQAQQLLLTTLRDPKADKRGCVKTFLDFALEPRVKISAQQLSRFDMHFLF